MVLPYDNMDYSEDQVGARNIPELNDVELTNLANGEILKYNSTSKKWENQPESGGGSLDNLTDTNITTPITNGSSLVYNTSNGKWENTLLQDIDTLDNLSDTNLTNLQDGQLLRYDSTSSSWLNVTYNIDDLNNVGILSVADKEILKYNSTSGNWENNNLYINEIGDVNITSLQNGEVLKYNSSSGKWENQDNTDTLNELSDVTLIGSINNQVLKYNGSIWVNNFVNLTELADTNISTLNNGDILRYNSTSQKWETDTFNIDDLDNVNITSVANNEVLKYNSVTSKWENSNRIDTLDELGDVTLTSVTSNDLLRYNGVNFVNTKIAFDNDFTNVNFTSLTNGDLIKYNGSNFINFPPTYLDGAGISDNFLIKVVSGASVQTTFEETSVASTSTSLKTFIPSGILSVLAGSIETEFFDTTKTRMHLTSTGINNAGGITITSDGRVGIGIVEPEEDLEVDGSIQIDSANVARLKFKKSGQNPHSLGEIDGEEDGTNGGDLQFYTKVDGVGGSVTEKLRINNVGAIGIGGANYGNSGQVMVSRGSGNPVEWASQINSVNNFSVGDVGAPEVPGQLGGIDLTGSVLSYVSPDPFGIRAAVSNGSLTQLVTTNVTINNAGAIGVNGGNEYGSAGDVLTSNGSTSSVRWRTPVIVGASLSSNSVSGSDGSALTVVFNNVEFETVSCYNHTTGVFTAPRTAHYTVQAYARVTDFSSPGTNGNRIQSILQFKPVGGSFYNYAVTDTVDVEANIKAGTGSSNMIIKLSVNEQIRYRVTMAGGGSWGLRGDAFELRGTYLSIHSID